MAQRGYKGDIWIARMNDHAGDMLRVRQTDVGPGSPAIRALVHSIPIRNVAADAGLPRAHINYVGIGIGHRDRTNRRNRLLIEQRYPTQTRVGGAPHAAAHAAEIKSIRVTGNPSHSQHTAAAVRTDRAPLQPLLQAFAKLIRGLRDERRHERVDKTKR